MHKLDALVKEMLEQHVGGEKFFDNLDDAIRRNEIIVDTLITSIPNIEEQYIIVSGKFGLFFRDYLRLLKIKTKGLIWVKGGLRHGHKPELGCYNLNKKEFIFIDDSFYSGKTRNTIQEHLIANGAKITNTYVVYDGSHVKEDNVYSLYRYYK